MRRRGSDNRLNFSSNELIHPALNTILEDVRAELTLADLRRYPLNLEGSARLAEYFRVQPDELLITPGSDSAIRLICAYYARRAGAEGILVHPRPHYDGWEQSARWHGLAVQGIEADWADPARHGRLMVQAARAARGALIALSVPGSPAGGCLTAQEIGEICDASRERGNMVVLDACYQAFNGPLPDQIGHRGGLVLVVQSLSKSHGLAGARVAVVCGDAQLVARLGGGPLEQAVSAPALLASKVAIKHHELLRSVWSEIGEVRDRVACRLRCSGLRTLPSRANFLTVCLGAESAAAVTRALSVAGYRIRNLSDLPGLSGCARFSIADRVATDRLVDLLLAAAFTVPGHRRS
jgi:histidinol-phosphate/aromatic aminotransferase/cobyric acid decarboxylase-like protein